MLGQNLKKLREVRKLGQKNLAEMLGVGTSTVAGWETGYRNPDREMLVKIADIFDVSVDSLLGRYRFDDQVKVESERMKYMSDIEKLRNEVFQTFEQAVADGVITEEQAKISLQLFRQNIVLMIESNRSK